MKNNEYNEEPVVKSGMFKLTVKDAKNSIDQIVSLYDGKRLLAEVPMKNMEELTNGMYEWLM